MLIWTDCYWRTIAWTLNAWTLNVLQLALKQQNGVTAWWEWHLRLRVPDAKQMLCASKWPDSIQHKPDSQTFPPSRRRGRNGRTIDKSPLAVPNYRSCREQPHQRQR